MVTNQGRVTGIDISEGMLQQAQEKIGKMGLSNVDLHVMDAESLEFRSNYFHHATCAYGIFFLPDMIKALKEWSRVVRPGGKIVFSCFGPGAFEPMAELFLERIGRFGVAPPNPDRPFGAKRTADPQRCREHLDEVAQLADEKGIWLDVKTHFCMGYKSG